MFFIASKIFWFLASPLHLILIGLGVGLAYVRKPFGRRLAIAAAAALAIVALLPVGALLLRPLENRFPPQSMVMPPPKGIIVLGGAIDEKISAARGQVTVNGSAERMITAVALSRLYPHALLVFSGGSAALIHHSLKEAQFAEKLWRELGVPDDGMKFDSRSRNTYENALYTKELVHPQPGERWLLITSAYHMPRAVGVFRALGMNPIPFPVDYRTTGTSADFRLQGNPAHAVLDFEMGAREWIGLTAYWLAGKTRTFFPAP